MSRFPIGQRIADPRLLSDELGSVDPQPDMYSSLANYTFGNPIYDALDDATESISPLTTFLGPDRTPRPSVSAQPASLFVSSHPSQGAGYSASHSRRHTSIRDPLSISSGVVSRSDPEKSKDPTPSTDPIFAAFPRSQRGKVMSDNASQHTFGPASRTHGITAASSQDGAAPPSSSASATTTSRSSSRASMHTSEQFSSDDELEIDYYDGSSSPVTFARDDLVEVDEDVDLVDPGPSTFQASLFYARRGSLPIAIPGVIQGCDPCIARSREGSILTVRRPSRSWDDASVHRSSHNVEDPSLILPKSEPVSRSGRLSLEVQLQSKQQQVVEPDTYHGLDLQYIFSKRSEGSIRSFNSRLSFVQPGAPGPRRSSSYHSAIPPGLGSTTALPFQDSFTRHLQIHDLAFDALRYYWSFQREKVDASGGSSRRRQQAHHHRTDKSGKEMPSRVQEMWRCGHVGRFKVDKLVFKPQASDPAKAAQQRIQVRHISDPYLTGNTITGPHSVIHKHSRAIAFSIFRSHDLFSGGRHAGGTGIGHSSVPMHMNVRSGTMLALKKVQEQYTSTKTVRQLGPFQSGDKKSGDSKEAKSKGKTKTTSKGRSKDKNDKKHHRPNPTESAESSTATSSAGSVNNSALQHMATPPEHPIMRLQFSHSTSSSTSVNNHDPLNRPVSSTSSLSPSSDDSAKVPESETSLIPPIRHPRDHRDSIDSEDRLPTRTTHAEAFSTLDPNDIENLRAKAHGRANPDSGSTLERFLRVFRGSSKIDDHSIPGTQPRAFQPPWLTTAGRDQQEENDRVLDDLNASFRDVGLLHTNPHKPPKTGSKLKSKEGVLDQIPDDCLYMLLPLWPGETDMANVHAENSSVAPFATVLQNRQYLLVYYVPFGKASPRGKKIEKKKLKQSQSSDSGVEPDAKSAFLPAFRVIARVVTYDELQLSGIRIPSDGLAVSGPEWEAINYPTSSPPRDVQMIDTVVCQCESRELGFYFLEHGLLKLGLCTREEPLPVFSSEAGGDEQEGKSILTPIGRAAVEMIWLGCLAITSFGPM